MLFLPTLLYNAPKIERVCRHCLILFIGQLSLQHCRFIPFPLTTSQSSWLARDRGTLVNMEIAMTHLFIESGVA
jgi:hypothetical protein